MQNFNFRSFLRNFYLSRGAFGCVFAYAVYNLLFSLRGLTVFQMSLLLAWWALAAAIFEVPTGAMADKWSRRKMLVTAPIIKAVCFIIWYYANGNFYLYALGFTFWALSGALVSGTADALLYDATVYAGRKDEYEKLLGKNSFYFYVAMAISMAGGGFIASYNIDLAIILSIIPILLSSVFAYLLQEVPKAGSTGEVHYFEYMRIAYREIKSSRVLIYLACYLLAISIFGDLEEFDQLYYKFVNLPVAVFGIVGFIGSSMSAFSTYFAHKLKHSTSVFYVLPLLSGLFLFVAAKFPSIPMIVALLLSYLCITPLNVLIMGRIQHNISSMSRATVTSIGNLFINLVGVILVPMMGLIGKLWNLPAVYLSTACFILVFAVFVFVARNGVAAQALGSDGGN